ncbi:MAG: M23 family metallopeptidase [Candidatus Riflebacteria bacterium]|nr:M23 family metallopeptidase [Candidatus Riflebacteria bacterium]
MNYFVLMLMLGMSCSGIIFAEPPRWPLDIEISPSSSYAEFRGMRFHGGVDLRTRMTTGFPVHAIADGFISRLKVQHRGFGYALYVDHPQLKARSVYGHLEDFAGPVAVFTHEKLSKMGAFYGIEDEFGPDRFPVKKGDIIAYSGDTGLGPAHLHIEFRTLNDEPISPSVLGMKVPDHIFPKLLALYFDPLASDTRINGGFISQSVTLNSVASTTYSWNQPVTIAGRAGLSIGLVDTGEGGNRFGVEKLNVEIDHQRIFYRNFEKYSYDENDQCPYIYDYRRSEAPGLGYVYTLFRWPHEKTGFSDGVPAWAGTLGSEKTGRHTLTITAIDFGGNTVKAEGPIDIAPLKAVGKSWRGALTARAISYTTFTVVVDCAPPKVAGNDFDGVAVRDAIGRESILPAYFGSSGIQIAFPIGRDWAGGAMCASAPLLPPLAFVNLSGGEIVNPAGARAIFPPGSLDFPILGRWVPRPDLVGKKPLLPKSGGWQLEPPLLVAAKPFKVEIRSEAPEAPARFGLYRFSGSDGYGYEGGEAHGGCLTMSSRAIAPMVILDDTEPPKARFVGSRSLKRMGPCWVYTVSDVGAGVNDDGYRIFIDGKKGIWDTDPDKSELYIVKPAGRNKSRHHLDITVVDHAGNRKQISEER